MSLSHGVFFVGVLGVMWSVYLMHKNPDVQFNLLDLLMENGRVSKVSCIVMGAFLLHSWIMFDIELHAKMTEGYLTIYGVTWVAPLIARLFMTNGASTPQAEIPKNGN